MRTPRLETIIWLSVELIVSFICVFFVFIVMEEFLSLRGVPPFDSIREEKLVTYLVSMVGASAVLLSSVRMTVAEYPEVKEEDEKCLNEKEQEDED